MFIIRVDDRLIHGQVIAGWVRPLGIENLVLSSDTIAADGWMRKAYALAVPGDVNLSILSIEDTIEALRNSNETKGKTMVIVESIKEVKSLVGGGLVIRRLILGCIGYSEGKIEITPYIYITKKEIRLLKNLSKNGIQIEAQALPNSPPVDVLAAIGNLETK